MAETGGVGLGGEGIGDTAIFRSTMTAVDGCGINIATHIPHSATNSDGLPPQCGFLPS